MTHTVFSETWEQFVLYRFYACDIQEQVKKTLCKLKIENSHCFDIFLYAFKIHLRFNFSVNSTQNFSKIVISI